ncbi:retrovirus-related pol polyprotein from transposon TNT 1-94 [Tanacetum coccineum]
MIKRDFYNELSKSYSKLEKHCIYLELAMQINQEIFQKDKSCENQNAPSFPEFCEINELKAQLQEKDTTVSKLKEKISSLRKNDTTARVKKDIDEIETINIELEHSVAKLLYENEHLHKEQDHLKKTYKELYDSIKKTRVQNKDQSDSLIAQINQKKQKGQNVIENAASIPKATIIAPGMFRLDLETLSPKLLKNRDAHIHYLKHTQEHVDILRRIVEQAKALQPLDNVLDYACIDLLTGSRGTNLYTLSIGDMMKSSPICLLSKASKTNKKHSHKPKYEDSNQEKLYLLHMDLCGPMRVESINGKKYILVIVDDYSRFTCLKFLRSKDEAPEFIIKFLKMIQVRLNATVMNIRTDNGTKFVNQL